MKVNILKHYQTLESNRVALINQHQAEVKSIEAQIAGKAATRKELESEKRKKEKLKADVLAEGVDVSKLDARIAELDAQIAQTTAETNGLREKLATQSALPKPIQDRVELLNSVLKNCYDCEEAIIVRNLDECWPHLAVSLGKLDDTGRPTDCKVCLGDRQEKSLKIKSSRIHYATGFRPEVLRWLPALQDSQAPNCQDSSDRNTPELYAFLEASEKLILSHTHFTWRTTRVKQSHSYGGREEKEQVEVEDNFSDLAESLSDRFDEIVAREGGELDLEKPYEGNRLMCHLRDFVLSQTTTQPPFEPASEEISSAEIYRTIKIHWDKLSSCPWSGEIRDNLALLKYYLENGEKARFWVAGFKHHHGFRLRTRDHSWIKGFIYVTDDAANTTNCSVLKIHTPGDGNHGISWVANLGSMWLNVGQPDRRRY